MPPDGYTTVTVTDDTAERLAEFMENHGLDSMDEAIDHAIEMAHLHEEDFSDAELAGMLADRLSG